MREVYRAEQLPVLQNRMFASAESARACARGDVVLVQSAETGLVFNRAFRPEHVEYDADYQNEQGLSTAFARHLDAVVDVMRRHFGAASLLEVGCGKGLFLERLLAADFDVTGLDPTYEGANPRVIRRFFTPEVGIRADGIVLRHVLEHVQDPVAFLAGLREANGGRGTIYIEVPCLDWIARHQAWFDIFYEHVNYFRRVDFERMFGIVHEAGQSFAGQYLYVVADLATLRPPRRPADDVFGLPAGFLAAIEESRDSLRAKGSATRAIWGGASKGVIFALLMERAGVPIDTVVDINPAKQGRYLAATGIRVQSPDEAMAHLPAGADVFVMNSNYLDEIEALTAHRFHCVTIERGNAP
ncbi:MAG: class I SAM-dependent methyltransferase [Pseudomonadota bacterium]|nr:class I SAM-dependent methyltransferase [Pseudomonadota bacterium]